MTRPLPGRLLRRMGLLLAVWLLMVPWTTPRVAAALPFPASPFVAMAPPMMSERGSSTDAATGEVFELLRVKVPAQHRQAWLAAEQASWEPWLTAQEGFLERRLFWDPQRQEGHLLIRWASRDQWKAIGPEAVQAVQERFEQQARQLTGSTAANPFPLVFEAELQPL